MNDDFNEEELFSAPRKTNRNSNPLNGYFRVPGLNIDLPSRGEFYPPGSVEFSMSGDVPVFPFRAADELIMKAPDALLSGYALENMISSCVPAIKISPREVCVCDLDTIMLAVRAASFGDKMDIETKCPGCSKENVFECDIPMILANSKPVPEDATVRLSADLVVYLRPHNVGDMTTLQMAAFREARALQAAESLPENERLEVVNAGYKRLTDLDQETNAGCVLKVVTPDAVVTDRAHIKEFMSNISSAWTKKIMTKVGELNQAGIDKTLECECSHCGHKWENKIEFDPSSFFDNGS